MDTQHYRHFLAVVEAGSMTAAAEFVHIAQPALSKQIRALEEYFGAKLIITRRGSKRIILTDAGEILYHKAKYICSLEDRTQNEIDELTNGDHGTLRFSLANSRATPFICRCLKPFHKLFPHVVFELYEGGLKEQHDQLLSGITEIGILSVPITHQNEFEVLFRRDEAVAALFAHDSRYLNVGEKTVAPEQLAELPLCMSAGCYMHFKKMFRDLGLTPNILSVCTTRTSVMKWVEDDSVVGVIPLDPLEVMPSGLRSLPIRDVDFALSKTVVKVKGRSLSMIAKKFLEFYGQLDEARRGKAVRKKSRVE